MVKGAQNERRRFLVSLREVEEIEQILTTKNLFKGSISVLNKDVCSNQTKAIVLD